MSDDYVSGGYDYTKEDDPKDNPIVIDTEISDDEGFAVEELAPDARISDIEKGSYRYLSPGVYPMLEVKNVEWSDKGTPINTRVFVKGENGEVRPDFFVSRRCKVTFCVPGDENNTTNDMFLIPPAERSQLDAWQHGFSKEKDAKEKSRSQGGFHDKKLKQFLGRLGFEENPETGKLPPSAGKFSNWKFYSGTTARRRIGLEIQRGKQQPDKIITDPKTGVKTTVTPTVYNQVKMYSYTYVDPPADVAVMMKQQNLARQRMAEAAATVANTVTNGATEDTADKSRKSNKKTTQV